MASKIASWPLLQGSKGLHCEALVNDVSTSSLVLRIPCKLDRKGCSTAHWVVLQCLNHSGGLAGGQKRHVPAEHEGQGCANRLSTELQICTDTFRKQQLLTRNHAARPA